MYTIIQTELLHGTKQNTQGLRPAEKKAGQALKSALNIHLAHETAELLQQALAITATTHEKIEGLRKYTPTTGIIEIPASLTRNLNNELGSRRLIILV